jgi:X-Pro dipeptidyl-peptidase
LALGSTARAADQPSIVTGADGETSPVFSYADAIRERVFIPVAGDDQDSDGVTDQVSIDIIRPQETNSGLKVPGDHRPEPALHLARARERVAVHPHDAGRRARPVPVLLRQLLRAGDGDADDDVDQFWQDRNYNLNVADVHAAVSKSQGLNDDNVRPNHFAQRGRA